MSNNPSRLKTSFLGVLAIIMGMLALLAPGLTGFSIIYLVGILVTITGFVRLMWAFQANGLGKGLLMLSIAILTLLCGIAMLVNPLFASGLMTILLTVYFIADGIIELMVGLTKRHMMGWGWLVFGGIISILLGVMILEQYPLSGTWAIGILFGIKMFFIGLIMITADPAIRQ